VKHAKLYRDHMNKDPLKSYGQVKYSMFNEPMQRIELLVSLNGSPEAAERNNGFHADREMQKLASGKDIPVSMACFVPYDVCSWCGNKSRTRGDYCDSIEKGGSCAAGGLKDNLGAIVQMVKEGKQIAHQLHADNPTPRFFDISHVFRPADRIAYVSGILEKAAGQATIGGAALAEALGVSVPYALLLDNDQPKSVQQLMKLAYRLADMEVDMNNGTLFGHRTRDFAGAFVKSAQETTEAVTPPNGVKLGAALRALADAHIALPLDRFVALTTGHSIEKSATIADIVRPHLPGVYSRMLAKSDFAETLAECAYMPATSTSGTAALWAEKQAGALSLAEGCVRRRAMQAVIRQEPVNIAADRMEKISSADTSVQHLADQYALYKLAFLSTVPEDDLFQLTASLVVLQNYAS
jgi:hypothetical protein